MKKINLFTDGGARGNPGPAGAGVVLKDETGKIIKTLGAYLGEKTNNEAEYLALILGLKTSLEEGVTDISCTLDSELVVKQLNGLYKVKNERMKPLFAEAKELELKFNTISYSHVKREENFEADKLVNEVLDARKA